MSDDVKDELIAQIGVKEATRVLRRQSHHIGELEQLIEDMLKRYKDIESKYWKHLNEPTDKANRKEDMKAEISLIKNEAGMLHDEFQINLTEKVNGSWLSDLINKALVRYEKEGGSHLVADYPRPDADGAL